MSSRIPAYKYTYIFRCSSQSDVHAEPYHVILLLWSKSVLPMLFRLCAADRRERIDAQFRRLRRTSWLDFWQKIDTSAVSVLRNKTFSMTRMLNLMQVAHLFLEGLVPRESIEEFSFTLQDIVCMVFLKHPHTPEELHEASVRFIRWVREAFGDYLDNVRAHFMCTLTLHVQRPAIHYALHLRDCEIACGGDLLQAGVQLQEKHHQLAKRSMQRCAPSMFTHK